jgi:hypothetical protein
MEIASATKSGGSSYRPANRASGGENIATAAISATDNSGTAVAAIEALNSLRLIASLCCSNLSRCCTRLVFDNDAISCSRPLDVLACVGIHTPSMLSNIERRAVAENRCSRFSKRDSWPELSSPSKMAAAGVFAIDNSVCCYCTIILTTSKPLDPFQWLAARYKLFKLASTFKVTRK